MSVVEVKDFSFTYPNGNTVLEHLSFSLEKGEMLLLCGSNGCGKSTLLRALKKEVAPKGTKSGTIAVSESSAFLFQECDKNIIFRTAFDDLIFPACNSGMPEQEILARAESVTALFGIQALVRRNTATLSGGEKQLVALASMMLLEPEVILLDEPLSQLDEQAKESFLQRLLMLKARGTAIIIAEHNTDVLLENSEKLLIFEKNGAQLYTRQTLGACKRIPDCPAYVTLEQKLQLPLKTYTRQEAVQNLKQAAPRLQIVPLRYAGENAQTVLSCNCLCFGYGDDPVLEQVSFHLKKGEIAFLCGKNGAGKSTLMYLLCDFYKAQSGTISCTSAHNIGYLSQNPLSSFLKETLLEDFLFLLKQNHLKESRMDEVFEAYPLFDALKPLLNANPLDLSGGERAKAAIFKLLLLGRDILLLDEPEKHLDKQSIEDLSAIIRALAQKGISLLIVSHLPDFIYRTAHTVLELQNGACTAYTIDEYFPHRCKTSLYRAIEELGLPLFDCSEAEVKHG